MLYELLNLIWSYLLILETIFSATGVLCKKSLPLPLPCQYLKEYFRIFSSCSFNFSSSILRYGFHFDFCVCRIRSGNPASLFYMWYSVFLEPVVEEGVFFNACFVTFVKLGDYRCVGVFLSCLFHHFTCLSLCQCHMVFVIITSLYNLISDISSVSFCLELFWYSGSLAGLHEYLGPIKQFKNQTPKKKNHQTNK